MKIKRIKSITLNSFEFSIVWDSKIYGGNFCYEKLVITIGTKSNNNSEIFMIICHELQELCATEMSVRFKRPDCSSDYIFVYDHRQHDTMSNMFSGLLSQFLK